MLAIQQLMQERQVEPLDDNCIGFRRFFDGEEPDHYRDRIKKDMRLQVVEKLVNAIGVDRNVTVRISESSQQRPSYGGQNCEEFTIRAELRLVREFDVQYQYGPSTLLMDVGGVYEEHFLRLKARIKNGVKLLGLWKK